MGQNFMNINPLITVIVPVYNEESCLENLLIELVTQNYENLEIICVDDGSTDRSTDIIKEFQKYDKRIQLYQKKNGGVSSARNVGLDYASGEYICFVDPGDKIDCCFISYLYQLIISEQADLAICSYDFVTEDGFVLNRSKMYEIVTKNTYFTREEAIKEIIHSYSKFCGHVWDKIYIRQLIGNIRFCEDIHNCEDTLFNVEYINKCHKIVLGPEIHYYYVQSESSATHGKYSYRFHTGILAWEKILGLLSNNSDKEYLSKNITCMINNYSSSAWKSLGLKEQRKYKKDFLQWMKKYNSYSSKYIKVKRVIYWIHWKII